MTNEFAIVDAVAETNAEDGAVFEALSRRPFAPLEPAPASASHTMGSASCVLARLHGFDLEDRPLVSGIDGLPGELVVARSTVALSRATVGAHVALAFEHGNLRLPIVLGVLQAPVTTVAEASVASVRIDDGERVVLRAERELVLQCGDASITLTRAGKVLIRGNYVLSQSSGYNRLKGAAIDIN